MSALEYPLEVLALNYSSFGFLTSVNSVWTWVVVITTTAAVSVYAIRASSASPRGKSPDVPSEWYQSPSPINGILQKLSNPAVEPDPIHTSTESSTPSDALTESNTVAGRTSGKFSLYYNGDDDVKINGCDCDNDDDDDDGEVKVLHWEGATLKMKMKGIGLYRCQDLRVLDGSVVRLWDECIRWNPVTPDVTSGGETVVTW